MTTDISSTPKAKLAVRPVCFRRRQFDRDLEQIQQIEDQCFDVAWNWHDLHNCLLRRECLSFVSECPAGVVGFAIAEFRFNGLWIVDFGVHENCRRRGVGRSLLITLVEQLIRFRLDRLTVRLPETNVAGQLLCREFGFYLRHVERGHFDSGRRDSYVLDWDLSVPCAEEKS